MKNCRSWLLILSVLIVNPPPPQDQHMRQSFQQQSSQQRSMRFLCPRRYSVRSTGWPLVYFNFGKVFEWWSDDSWCNFMSSDVNLHTKQNTLNAAKHVRMCQKGHNIFCVNCYLLIPQYCSEHAVAEGPSQWPNSHGRAAIWPKSVETFCPGVTTRKRGWAWAGDKRLLGAVFYPPSPALYMQMFRSICVNKA